MQRFMDDSADVPFDKLSPSKGNKHLADIIADGGGGQDPPPKKAKLLTETTLRYEGL